MLGFCFCDVVSWFKGCIWGGGIYKLFKLCCLGLGLVRVGDLCEGILIRVLDVWILEPLVGVSDGVVGRRCGIWTLPGIRTCPTGSNSTVPDKRNILF